LFLEKIPFYGINSNYCILNSILAKILYTLKSSANCGIKIESCLKLGDKYFTYKF